jgi:hypothetical protein
MRIKCGVSVAQMFQLDAETKGLPPVLVTYHMHIQITNLIPLVQQQARRKASDLEPSAQPFSNTHFATNYSARKYPQTLVVIPDHINFLSNATTQYAPSTQTLNHAVLWL